MLLAYCIIEELQPEELQLPGAGGKQLFAVEEAGVRVVCSEVGEAAPSSTVSVEEAKEFNRVLQSLFSRTDVLPFRYPTVVTGEDDLRNYLAAHADAYAKAISRLRGTVQFQFKISPAAAPVAASSGTDYMQQRLAETRALDNAARQAQAAIGEMTLKWRERTTIRTAEPRGQTRQCYVLVRRGDSDRVRQAIAAARFDPATHVLMSGPWPPSEFFRQAESSPEAGQA